MVRPGTLEELDGAPRRARGDAPASSSVLSPAKREPGEA